MQIVVQVIYFLWKMRIFINQDKFQCIVIKNVNYPQFYKDKDDFDKLMDDPSAVNVTKNYEIVFGYNLLTYVLLDVNLAYTYFLYRKSVINKNYKPEYTYTFCFFIFFVFFGIVELIMLIALRFSKPGQICSGDYLKENDPLFTEEHYEYFMRYEGYFVNFVVAYVLLSVVSFIIMTCLVNSQRFYNQKLDQTYIAPSVMN